MLFHYIPLIGDRSDRVSVNQLWGDAIFKYHVSKLRKSRFFNYMCCCVLLCVTVFYPPKVMMVSSFHHVTMMTFRNQRKHLMFDLFHRCHA